MAFAAVVLILILWIMLNVRMALVRIGGGFLMVAEMSTFCAICGDGDDAHDHVVYR